MKEESLSKAMIKRIVFIALVLIILLGVSVLAGTQSVNTVTIKFSDNTELTVITAQKNVNEILKENNIYIFDYEQVTPGVDENIGEDKVITISKKSTEEVEEDDSSETVETIESTEILEDTDVVIVEKIIKETVEIPYETVTKEVSSTEGEETTDTVVQEGQNGIKEITYKVKYENDVEIERTQLSEEIIQEPVDKIVQVTVKTSSRSSTSRSSGTTTVSTGNGTWTYSSGDFDLLCAITAQECSSSYEGALAVITSACNRAENRGTDPLTEYKRQGQYCYSIDSYWMKYLNGNYSSTVSQAVTDALNGVRNHSYTSFRSASSGYSGTYIGGNVYF